MLSGAGAGKHNELLALCMPVRHPMPLSYCVPLRDPVSGPPHNRLEGGFALTPTLKA